MATEVKDLPIEVIAKIFSFLDEKEISKLSIVCSNFNAAAKDPSLWRKCEVFFRNTDERKISSFCNFFSQNPHLQVLSIMKEPFWNRSDSEINVTSVNSFNKLFENLKNLVCLNIEINLTNIFLPPSLKHLTCKSYLEKCPQIEHLYLDSNDFEMPNAVQCVRSVLLKYQTTLKAFYLKVDSFEMEWIPLITSCVNLKEFGLQLRYRRKLDLSKLFETLSSRLEVLYVNSVSTSRSFCNFEFPELKHLTVDSNEDDVVTNFLQLIKQMPKLESLRFSGYKSDRHDDFVKFVKTIRGCETLKYLKTDCFDFSYRKESYTYIIREGNKGSKNECWDVNYYDSRIMPFLMAQYKCSCLTWNSDNIYERSLLLKNPHQLLLINDYVYDRRGVWGVYENDDDLIDDYFEQNQ